MARRPPALILRRPHGRAGTRIWVDVRLTNPGPRRFRFPWCPEIVEGIDGGDGAYRSASPLNCHGLGTISPGRTIVFRMPVWIHPDFPPGLHELGWGVRTDDGGIGADVYTTTPIVVDP